MTMRCPDCRTWFVNPNLHRNDCVFAGYSYEDIYEGVIVDNEWVRSNDVEYKHNTSYPVGTRVAFVLNEFTANILMVV